MSILLFAFFVQAAHSAPASPLNSSETSPSFSMTTTFITATAFLSSILALLWVFKVLFTQRRPAPASFFKDMPSGGRSWRGVGPVSRGNRSPFWLGFLGSPAQEIAFVSGDLLNSSSTRLLKRRCERSSIKSIFGMVLGMASSRCTGVLARDPLSWRGVRSTTGDVLCHPHLGCYPKNSLKDCFSPLNGAGLLPLPFPCRTPDRCEISHIDTFDVNAGSDFSTSAGDIAADSYSPSFASHLDRIFGPAPGFSFLENLESSSPMPLRFRLPSPLLPTRKKSNSSKTRSPIRAAGTPPEFPPSKPEPKIPLEHSLDACMPFAALQDQKPSSGERLTRASPYPNLGLGWPSPSPVLCETEISKDEDATTLENMLEQLAQATNDWDDSIFVDDKFKSLITSHPKRNDPALVVGVPFGATNRDTIGHFLSDVGLLEEVAEECDSFSRHSSLDSTPCVLRDRTRDLLFSIPEEEAISFCDVVIQSY